MALAASTWSPEFLSSVFENWESEFLQMSAYVDAPPRDADLERQAGKESAPAINGRPQRSS